jgi:hypothetical protein
MKWIKINSEKDLPKNIHFKNHTEFWACAKGVVFKIYFYNSYGGKNYSIAEYNSSKTHKELDKIKVPCMGEVIGNLDYYAKLEIPKSPYEMVS